MLCIQDGFYINANTYDNVSQPSYAKYVYMNVLLPYHSTTSLVSPKLSSLDFGNLLRGKPQHSVVVNGVCNLLMPWMCICMNPYLVTAALVDQAFNVSENSGYHTRSKPQHSVVIEAIPIQVGSHINFRHI